MKISYIFPSRSRPAKAIKCLDNIHSLARHDDFEIIMTCDIDDPTMFNPEMRDKINSYPNTAVHYGLSETKVAAVNLNVPLATGDILLTHSDDMMFIKEGFDLDIIKAFENFDGLVHFPDQIQKTLVTYSMVSKSYYDIDGWIYHPDFVSVYCDDLQTYLAKKRGKYKLVDKPILRHEHPIWGYGEKDALLIKTEDPLNYANDKKIYERLKKEYKV